MRTSPQPDKVPPDALLSAGIESPATAQTASRPTVLEGPSPEWVDTREGYADYRIPFGAGLIMCVGRDGWMPRKRTRDLGLFLLDNRVLDRYYVTVNDHTPTFLRHTDGSYSGAFLYNCHSNPDPRSSDLSMVRQMVIEGPALHERLRLQHFGLHDQTVKVEVCVGSRFEDLIGLRGMVRDVHGRQLTRCRRPRRPTIKHGNLRLDHRLDPQSSVAAAKALQSQSILVLSYRGADGCVREVNVLFSSSDGSTPTITTTGATFELNMGPQAVVDLEITFEVSIGDERVSELLGRPCANFEAALASAKSRFDTWRSGQASVTTSNVDVNAMVDRAIEDLYQLRVPTPHGWCLTAGTVLYNVPFGRDLCTTIIQTAAVMPNLARETLDRVIEWQGPLGETLHEIRFGELAKLGPHGQPVYSSVDAGALYLIALARLISLTNDVEYARKHEKAVRKTLQWLDGKVRENGYVSYPFATPDSTNECWQDSKTSMIDEQGEQCGTNRSVVEVQALVFIAWSLWSDLADRLGWTDDAHQSMGQHLKARADALRYRFLVDFWDEQRGFPALLLHGQPPRPAFTRKSNQGYAVLAGLLPDSINRQILDALSGPDFFTGRLVRTMARNQPGYNPYSYHNGSCWAHDNWFIHWAACLMRHPLAHAILHGMIESSRNKSDKRLSELEAGLGVDEWAGPPADDVLTNVPQAWAAGSALGAVINMLGLDVRHEGSEVVLHLRPFLSANVSWMKVEHLQIAGSTVSIELRQTEDGLVVDTHHDGGLRVVVQE